MYTRDELTREDLLEYRTAVDLYDDIDQPYTYPAVIRAPFPNKRGDLSIVSQDYSYTMDIMYLTSLGEERYGRENGKYKNASRRTKGHNIRVLKDEEAHEYSHYVLPYECALVIVETTSRKAWAYPMHSKHAGKILYNFRQFLEDVDFHISKLMSDNGLEYEAIKKFNNMYNIFHYYQVDTQQNMHTSLSRVDRFIRTLRGMIRDYYAVASEGDWTIVLRPLVEKYNNTIHSSLYLKNGDFPDGEERRQYYTPNQVFGNPELRRRIKIKDYLLKYRNYRYLNKFLKWEQKFIIVYYLDK